MLTKIEALLIYVMVAFGSIGMMIIMCLCSTAQVSWIVAAFMLAFPAIMGGISAYIISKHTEKEAANDDVDKTDLETKGD